MAGGGVAMDLGPHGVDLLRSLAGDVATVQATMANVRFRYEVEDLAMATLRFAAGPVGRLDVSYCTHEYGGRLEAMGSEATVVIEGSLQQLGPYRIWRRQGRSEQPVTIIEGQFNDGYTAAIEEFADAVLQDRQPLVTAADGLRCVEVIEAMYASAKDGQVIALE